MSAVRDFQPENGQYIGDSRISLRSSRWCLTSLATTAQSVGILWLHFGQMIICMSMEIFFWGQHCQP